MTNEGTLFQRYHLESSAQILGFLKIEITNLRSEFYHLERAGPKVLRYSWDNRPDHLKTQEEFERQNLAVLESAKAKGATALLN